MDTFSWTPIVVPVGGPFNNLTLAVAKAAGGAVKFRTDTGDSDTEFTLNAGIQVTVDGAVAPHTVRFIGGEIALWAQAVSGTGPVEHFYR